jgi:hypothetical protein
MKKKNFWGKLRDIDEKNYSNNV